MNELEICSIRGIRRYVMKRTWQKIKEAEDRGEIVTHADFGRIIREAWKEAKEEAEKVCRLT